MAVNEFDIMITILEKSIEKNGNQTLTVQHLLNIMRLTNKKCEEIEEELDDLGLDCLNS